MTEACTVRARLKYNNLIENFQGKNILPYLNKSDKKTVFNQYKKFNMHNGVNPYKHHEENKKKI